MQAGLHGVITPSCRAICSKVYVRWCNLPDAAVRLYTRVNLAGFAPISFDAGTVTTPRRLLAADHERALHLRAAA